MNTLVVWYVGSNRKHQYNCWSEVSAPHLVNAVKVGSVKVSGWRRFDKVTREAVASCGGGSKVTATIVYAHNITDGVRVRISSTGDVEVEEWYPDDNE